MAFGNLLGQLAGVQSVNNTEPDDKGNVTIGIGVQTVNGQAPDEKGNVDIDLNSWAGLKAWNLEFNHPIGSIYCTLDEANPGAKFGGTWEKIQGRFLLGSGTPGANNNNYFGTMSGESWTATTGQMGGQDYHTLTIKEMPKHHHEGAFVPGGAQHDVESNTVPNSTFVTRFRDGRITEDAGGDEKHNNMPPYLVVNIWKRTA